MAFRRQFGVLSLLPMLLVVSPALAGEQPQFSFIRDWMGSPGCQGAGTMGSADVAVSVPQGTDLRDEKLAKSLLEQAKEYALANCKSVHPSNAWRRNAGPRIHIYIFEGPPPEKLGADERERVRIEGRYTVYKDGAELEGYDNIALKRFKEEQEALARRKAQEEAVAARRKIIAQAEAQGGGSASFRVRGTPCDELDPTTTVEVHVPPEVDLGNDQVAKAYTEEALAFAYTQCQKMTYRPGWDVPVYVYQGGEKEKVLAEWRKGYMDAGGLWVYRNMVIEQRKAEQKAKEEAERREATLRPIRQRLKGFKERYEVADLLSCNALATNPYTFEGKVVAVYGAFDSMVARDKGVFSSGECGFSVSSIPSGTFGTRRWYVLIAGKVLGQTEVKVPLLGAIQVPHLRFVGVHICQEEKCTDILPLMNK